MGFHKIKRPLLFPGGQSISGGASTTPGSLTGDIDFSTSAGLRETVQTATSTGTLRAYGASFLLPGGSTADKVFTLPNPPSIGLHKYIINGTSGVRLATVQITTSTASGQLFGTTFRQIQFSSAAPAGAEASETVQLISRTTAQWAVASASTGVTFAA